MYKLAIVGLFVATAMALPAAQENNQPPTGLDCLEEDALFSCLFVKASTALDRAARSSNINLIDGVTFVRDTPREYSSKSLCLITCTLLRISYGIRFFLNPETIIFID